MRRLEAKDLSLCHSMISPLGSCTMKLNATSEMFPVSWPEFGALHPFAPAEQTRGYQKLFRDLETWLSEITGFAAVSLQPNAGSQGEYAATACSVIRAFHGVRRGEGKRSVFATLFPNSAHGTNPASADDVRLQGCARRVRCQRQHRCDRPQRQGHRAPRRSRPKRLMVYRIRPRTACSRRASRTSAFHDPRERRPGFGMDGANMNAQVGLTSPGFIGADVCHLNLHTRRSAFRTAAAVPAWARSASRRTSCRCTCPATPSSRHFLGRQGAARTSARSAPRPLRLGSHSDHLVDVHPHDGTRRH